jgi:adenylate cyclase
VRDGATAGDAALDGVPALTEVLRTGDAVVIDDAARSTLVPSAWLETGVSAAIVAPLLYREEAIGTLTLERRQRPGPWLREQIDLARAIAYQAASAIGAARPRR